MLPYCESPVPQTLFEKSSVKVDKVERELVLVFVSSAFVFLFVLRFATLFELFELRLLLLLLSLVMLLTAKTRITTPIPMNTSTAPIPSSQGQMLRFCGPGGGIGLQAGGGVGGGACPGLNAIVA